MNYYNDNKQALNDLISDLENDNGISIIAKEDVESELDYASKCHNLEEQLGCPLEVVFKALKEGIYQSDGGRRKYPTIEYNGATKKFYFAFGTYCNVEDYKKTWWLREARSE